MVEAIRDLRVGQQVLVLTWLGPRPAAVSGGPGSGILGVGVQRSYVAGR